MIHEILPVGPLQCNCSVIGDETTREAMGIDPGDEIEEIVAILGRQELQVKQIVIAHANLSALVTIDHLVAGHSCIMESCSAARLAALRSAISHLLTRT